MTVVAPPDDRSDAARAQLDRVVRASYGRLLAILAAPTGDIELAEDGLGFAFERALATWPDAAVPDKPEAWLLTVARNRMRDVLRSPAQRDALPMATSADRVAAPFEEIDPDAIPDRRLGLMFLCAHPAIDAAVRTPLMLQVVLGLDAERIADAFAVRPAAMAQRLVRAKRRIRAARIPFGVPGRARMRERLPPVLEAIYGAYAIDWRAADAAHAGALAGEAAYLASLLAEQLPDEPEVHGLAALISLSLARRPARGTADVFVPLEEQDPSAWDRPLIARGEHHLRRAYALGRPGRFQLEAAIQSAHCDRAVSGRTDWQALRTLYAALVDVAPTLGARVACAATIGRTDGAAAGLAALDDIDDAAVARFQPFWATRAHLLAAAGRSDEAASAFDAAIALSRDDGMRAWLEARAAELPRVSG